MTISYNLGSSPFWSLFGLTGLSLGGGSIASFRSDNPSVQKPIFQDPAGANAYPNPILIPLNGQMTPMYFQFDTGNPNQNYFIIVSDSQGNIVAEIQNYTGAGAGGGGSIVSNINLNNLVINNVFWRNGGTISNVTTPALANGSVLAPSSHSAFVFPDWTFNLVGTCTQSFSFPASNSVLVPPALTGDVNPELILQYQGNSGGTDSVKQIRVPISSHIASLQNQPLTVHVWAQTNSVGSISMQLLQYGGTGTNSPTNNTVTIIPNTALTSTWTRYGDTITIPSFPGTVGNNGNDGIYLLINLPVQQTVEVNLTKLTAYVGGSFPLSEFLNYDQIDSTINTPRTGDFKLTIGPSTNIAPFGWVAMNDGTIGSPSSGATLRANNDTYYLYKMLWNQTNTDATTKTYAPVTGGRSASADADFSANKPMQLLYSLGAVLANTGVTNAGSGFYTNLLGTNWALGQPAGGESVLLAHNHTSSTGGNFVTQGFTSGQAGTLALFANAPTTADAGNVARGSPTIQPTLRVNYFMKL